MQPLYIFFSVYQHVVGKKPKWSWDWDEGRPPQLLVSKQHQAGTLSLARFRSAGIQVGCAGQGCLLLFLLPLTLSINNTIFTQCFGSAEQLSGTHWCGAFPEDP